MKKVGLALFLSIAFLVATMLVTGRELENYNPSLLLSLWYLIVSVVCSPLILLLASWGRYQFVDWSLVAPGFIPGVGCFAAVYLCLIEYIEGAKDQNVTCPT